MKAPGAWPGGGHPLAAALLRALLAGPALLWASVAWGVGLLVVTSLGAVRLAADRSPDDVQRQLFQSTFGLTAGALLLVGPAVSAALTRQARDTLDETSIVCAGGARALTVALLVQASVALLVPMLASSAALVRPLGGVSGGSVCLGALSLVGLAVAMASVGSALGASSPNTARALTAGLTVGSLALGLGAWLLGRVLGAHLCAKLHVGYHGLFWWPELASDPRVPRAVRNALLLAPTCALSAVAVLGALGLRCQVEPAPGRPWHLVRLALLALTIALTAVAWRVVALPVTRLGREATAITALGVVATASLLGLLGLLAEGPAGRPRAAPRSLSERAWDALCAHGVERAVGAQLGATALCLAALAWRSSRVIAAARGPQGLAPLAPYGAAWVLLGALALAFGLGAWLRGRRPAGRVRALLAAAALALHALPYPALELAGGASGPLRHAGLLPCTSALYGLRALDRTARRRLVPRDLRRRGPRALGDVTASLAVASASGLLGAGLLWASGRRRRRGEAR